MKIKLLCFAVLLFLPVLAAAQTTDEIVTKALAARGGVSRIKAVHSQRITGTINFGAGADGPFLVELERPGKMHIEVTVQGQTLVRSYDGKSTGWIFNPFTENKTVQPMTAEDISNISDESDFDGPLVDYKQKGNLIALVGKEDVDGKPAYRLKLTNKKGEMRSYIFHDYRDVDGLQFAFEIDSDAPGTGQAQQIIADKIEVDPQMDESHFGKPVAPAAPSPADTPADSPGATSPPSSEKPPSRK